MDNNRQLIYSDAEYIKIWKYGHKERSKISQMTDIYKDNISEYVKTKYVYDLGNFIFFISGHGGHIYHKLRKQCFSTYNVIDGNLLMYRNRLYEIFYLDFEKIRVDIYNTISEKYVGVNHLYENVSKNNNINSGADRETNYCTIIQGQIDEPLDHSQIIRARVLYDYLWPNYVVNRSAYCDVTVKIDQ